MLSFLFEREKKLEIMVWQTNVTKKLFCYPEIKRKKSVRSA